MVMMCSCSIGCHIHLTQVSQVRIRFRSSNAQPLSLTQGHIHRKYHPQKHHNGHIIIFIVNDRKAESLSMASLSSIAEIISVYASYHIVIITLFNVCSNNSRNWVNATKMIAFVYDVIRTQMDREVNGWHCFVLFGAKVQSVA